MPPPPPPANVYPCLDWVPQGVARTNPDRLRLTGEELKTVIAETKSKALGARRRLIQSVQEECSHLSGGRVLDGVNKIKEEASDSSSSGLKTDAVDEDDIIMKEYGLEDYDEEDGRANSHQKTEDANEMSEDDAEHDGTANTAAATLGLAEDIAALTYHSSNDEDPYLAQEGDVNKDDEEEEQELMIKPTDNLIIAGHVSKDESSIEVYVYDNEQNNFYLHHDIIQADYPCCVRWVGHARNRQRNLAAAGYMNPDIFLWDLDVVDALEPIEILAGHSDAVIDISWNSQVKNIIASGSADKHVRIWNLDECKSISNIKLTGKVSALEFGIYEQFMLLAGDLNRHVSLIDTRSSSVVSKWKLSGEVEKVRWIPVDHSKFLVSDDQGYVYCFDMRHTNNGQPAIKFRAHQISVTGLEFSPKCDDMLVTASADDTIKVWDTKVAFRSSKTAGTNPTLIKEITDLKVGSILSLRMCPNSLGMIAVGGDSKCNSFKTYDLTSDKEGKLICTRSLMRVRHNVS